MMMIYYSIQSLIIDISTCADSSWSLHHPFHLHGELFLWFATPDGSDNFLKVNILRSQGHDRWCAQADGWKGSKDHLQSMQREVLLNNHHRFYSWTWNWNHEPTCHGMSNVPSNWQDQFDKDYWWSQWRWYPFGSLWHKLGLRHSVILLHQDFHQKRPFLTGHEWCPWSQKYNSCHCLGLLCRKTWIKKWKDCTTRKCTWIVWIVEMKLMSMGHRVTTCSLPNIQLLFKSKFKRILCSWPMPMAAKRPLWTLWCLGDAVSRADTCTGMELLRSYLTTSTHSTHCSSPACSATTKGTCTAEPCR